MKTHNLHSWQVDTAQAKEIQLRLAKKVVTKDEELKPGLIGGMDISAPNSKGIARGAAVILRYPDLELIEVETAEIKLDFPYIPGLLSFRECPLLLAVCEKVSNVPDLILVDGQGLAHPRRFGLASHLGLFLDIPTIGCAKSILCGKHSTLGEEVYSHTELVDNGEIIGAALRTKTGTKPIYVSIGNRIALASALYWAGKCCRGYRMPEPTRLAHLAAGGNLVWQPGYQAKSFHSV